MQNGNRIAEQQPAVDPSEMDATCLITASTILTAGLTNPWIPKQPKRNVWVMLATAIGQNTLSLSLITLQLPTLLRENADSNCNSLMKYMGLLVTSERCSLDEM